MQMRELSNRPAARGTSDDGRQGLFGTVTNKAVSKVTQYKWKLKDRPGEFVMIPKSLLNVDPLYQRDLNNGRANDIARNWSWVSCGTLSVILREPDAEYMIIDGMHRWGGALKRDDIKELPCMLFEAEDVTSEAQAFLDVNTKRRVLMAAEKFRALIMTNDSNAEFVNRLIGVSGRHVSMASGATTIACIGALMSCSITNKEAIAKIWPLIVKICEGNPLHQRMVKGMFYLETHANGFSLCEQRWSRKLLDAGFDKIMQKIDQFAALKGGAGNKICAEGVLEVLNFKLKEQLSMKSA